MPSVYAHYIFGKEVLKHLNGEVKNLIEENKELYSIGLHGPDICFFYRPLLIGNRITRMGSRLHNENALPFFQAAREKIKNPEEMAYILGFICHFMLDSECHPYINANAEKGIAEHFKQESDFDRYLLCKEGKNPIRENLTGHIFATKKNAALIQPFFSEATEKIIWKSLDYMISTTKKLQAPTKLERALLKGAFHLTGQYKKLSGLLMPEKPDLECIQTSQWLEKKLFQAVKPSTVIVQEYYEGRCSNAPLNIRFNRNYK